MKIIDVRGKDFKAIIKRERNTELNTAVDAVVLEILKNVKENGDAALRAYTARFDGVELSGSMEVTEQEMQDAYAECPSEYIKILEEARENITFFHRHQLPNGFRLEKEDGIVLGQKYTPLERVGVYVPGGTASYPSTVLMDVIPARIAGVKEIIMATPPKAGGKIPAPILAAAGVAGVTRIIKMGGAQAVAALAFGTETIPKVDKIVGPGNLYVATAKRMVYGTVDIDMVAGPSDVLIVADGTAVPAYVAADMLAQAEHDVLASAVLVTTDAELIPKVERQIKTQLATLTRREIAEISIENNALILLASDVEQAIAIANEIAPEHLELCVEEPFSYLDRVVNAGSIFLGNHTPEALGDYLAGPNHTLPTEGTARFSSPLSVDDYMKKSSYLYYTPRALDKVMDKVAYFAESEQLTAHARSATIRKEGERSPICGGEGYHGKIFK